MSNTTERNGFKIGETVICAGHNDVIELFLDNDPDGYEVSLKEEGTQTFAMIEKLPTTAKERKHTKGEWCIGYGNDSKALGIFRKDQLDNNTFDHPICLISPIYQINERDLANAQRIVTAVNSYDDMLEALKGFIHSVEHEGVISGRVVDAVRNAQSVIAKAQNSK